MLLKLYYTVLTIQRTDAHGIIPITYFPVASCTSKVGFGFLFGFEYGIGCYDGGFKVLKVTDIRLNVLNSEALTFREWRE